MSAAAHARRAVQRFRAAQNGRGRLKCRWRGRRGQRRGLLPGVQGAGVHADCGRGYRALRRQRLRRGRRYRYWGLLEAQRRRRRRCGVAAASGRLRGAECSIASPTQVVRGERRVLHGCRRRVRRLRALDRRRSRRPREFRAACRCGRRASGGCRRRPSGGRCAVQHRLLGVDWGPGHDGGALPAALQRCSRGRRRRCRHDLMCRQRRCRCCRRPRSVAGY